MPRPINERRICCMTPAQVFKPAGIPMRDLEEVILTLDEAEAVRLADIESLYQEAAARRMGVSRQTFGRIVDSARKKIADAVINGKALRIEGGEVTIHDEGETVMKIAVPARDGLVDAHFGHCEYFQVFSLDEQKKIINEERVDPPEGCGCKSNIVAVLAQMGVTHMVAGNMGEGAVHVLQSHGIQVIRGAAGNVKEAAERFAAGTLADSGVGCEEHEHHHGNCGEHHHN